MTRTSHEWKKMFGRGHIPGAAQRWLQEWVHDEFAETSGLMIDVNDPVYGEMTQPGPVVWMEESGEEALLVHRLLDDGYQRVRVRLPAVLGVSSEMNDPRAPSMKGTMIASRAWPATTPSTSCSAAPTPHNPTTTRSCRASRLSRSSRLNPSWCPPRRLGRCWLLA